MVPSDNLVGSIAAFVEVPELFFGASNYSGTQVRHADIISREVTCLAERIELTKR